MPTAVTVSSYQQSMSSPTANQPPPARGNNQQPDVYHQTLLNTLVSQQAQLATNQTSSVNKDQILLETWETLLIKQTLPNLHGRIHIATYL